MTRISIVNEDDEVIAHKERYESTPDDIDQVSALWLTNSKGEVLIAQRSFTKVKDPGVWGPAAAGTVEEGETYLSNIVKEAEEEIGLMVQASDLTLGPKMRIKNGNRNYFCQWFTYVCDCALEEFVLQKEEVEQIAWVNFQDLRRNLLEHPENYTPAMTRWIDAFS